MMNLYPRIQARQIVIISSALFCGLFFHGKALTAQQPPPKPVSHPVPPNVEKFTVKTASRMNPEIPFYVRPPADYSPGQPGNPRRVLFVCPYHNQDALLIINNSPFVKLADKKGWFVIMPTFKSTGDVQDRDTCYYYPEKFSGPAVREALEMIRKKYPIAVGGMLMQGYSGGAQFVHRFAIWAPDLVAAVVVNSSSWFDRPDPRSGHIAWLVTIGESDPAYEHSLEFVDQLRNAGAVPVFRSYIGVTHKAANTAGVVPLSLAFLSYWDEVTRPQLGAQQSFFGQAKTKPLASPADMPFVGDAQEWRYFKNTAEALRGIPEESRVYLPSGELAEVWQREN